MRCVSYAATVISVFVGAQAMQLGVHGVGQSETKGHEWIKSITTSGSMNCSVNDECVVGAGMGACTLEVDPAVPMVVGPTDSGHECEMVSGGNTHEYPWKPFTHQDDDITLIGHTESSHWNICWTTDKQTRRQAPPPDVNDYCHDVNGLCFLWASPCSGGCSNVTISLLTWFCPTLRYATEAEFSAALPIIDTIQGRAAFWQKCAATIMDPYFSHCDFMNDFARVPDGHWNELLLVCPDPTSAPTPTPTPAPTFPPGGGAGTPAPSPVSATGDPHLQNVYGERFDLMQPGKHVLIQIPKRELDQGTLLRVRADARRLGGNCAELYFQELNVTGVWAEAKYTGGLRFTATGSHYGTPSWLKFGKVQIKVSHGHTKEGTQYLNFYVKHLGHAGFAVGGLLGEDDHKEAAKPPPACAHHTSLLQVAAPSESVNSVAEATFA